MNKLKDINWNQVYCFYEVARRLSMKEAGKALGVSTPTVSEQIKRLEALLGVSLFRRMARRIELTREGEALFHNSREIFDAAGRFLDNVSTESIGGYPVRVGIQESICVQVAIDAVTDYWDLYAPYGTVNTIRETLYDRLIERLMCGELDWAITLEKPKSLKLEHKPLCAAEVVFCCSPRIYQRFREPKDILKSIPLARSSWDRILNEATDDYLRREDVYPEEVIESDHREFCISLTQRGRAVTALARETVEKASWRDQVQTFYIDEPIHLQFNAVWPRANEKMISIRKLKELLDESRTTGPLDPDLQIKVSDVPEERLQLAPSR